MEPRKTLAYVAVCALLLGVTGCFDEDDVTVPDIPQADPVAEVAVDECATLAADLLTEIDNWTQGNLGKDLKTTPEWDPACQCWHWVDIDGNLADPLDWWSRTWTFYVSFLHNDVPQMEFEGADRIHADINFSYADSYYADESDNYNRTLAIDLSLDATDFLTGVVNIAGEGSGHVFIYLIDGDLEIERNEEIDVDIALSIPLGGCPTGSMAFTIGTSTLVITFNGTATASWVYTPDGNADFATDGTFGLGCGG